MVRRLVVGLLAAQGLVLLVLTVGAPLLALATGGFGTPMSEPLVLLAGGHVIAVAGYVRHRPWAPKLAAVIAGVVLVLWSLAIGVTLLVNLGLGPAPGLVLVGLIMAANAIVLAGSIRETRSGGRAAPVP